MSEGSVRHCQPQVAAYLCADPSVFVTPEYYVTFGEKEAKGDRIIDLFAWDARLGRYFVVEVTTNKSFPKALGRRIATDWARKKDLIRSLTRNGIQLSGGQLWWWVFIRRPFIPRFKDLLPTEMSPFVRLTALECTHFYPDYKDARRVGTEPADAGA